MKKTSLTLLAIRKDGQFKCLDGCRVFFAFYIILGHYYIFQFNDNEESMKKYYDIRHVLYFNHLIVDSFVLVSGC